MRQDLLVRLVPFTAVVSLVWLLARPAWLGLAAGRLDVQVAAGVAGGILLFTAAALLQLTLAPLRGALQVPGSLPDAALQAIFFLANAAVEEAFFRGLLQGGLTALAGPAAGIALGTGTYVLYHRLGSWAWIDVAATALAGIPLALTFWLLPGPPSLIAVFLAHFGATSGFIGPGPWLLRGLGLVGQRTRRPSPS